MIALVATAVHTWTVLAGLERGIHDFPKVLAFSVGASCVVLRTPLGGGWASLFGPAT